MIGPLLALDDFVLDDYAIPDAMITRQSSALGFGVERRAGMHASVFFGQSAQPARWEAHFLCPDEDARYALMAVLAAPRDAQLRLLARRDDAGEDLISTYAAVSNIRAHGSSDNITVEFESNDSVWIAETADQASKVFATTLDQSLHLPVGGNVPTVPRLTITPQGQRSTSTAAVGWKKRRRFQITNNGDQPLFRYPVRITVANFLSVFNGTTARADGADLRAWLDGVEQPIWMVAASPDVHVWVIVPALAVGASLTYELVYGNLATTLADQPRILFMPSENPAFAMGDSSNTQWKYLTNDNVANAGFGLWPLSSGLEGGSADYTVPGAWQPQLTYGNPDNDDNRVQSRSFRWDVDPNEWYQAILNAGRWKGGGFLTLDEYAGADPFDGITLSNPFGITSVNVAAWEWSNYGFVKTVVTTTVGDETESSTVSVPGGPFTRVVVLGRDSGGDGWHVIQQYGGDTGGTDTEGSTTWTPPSAVKHFGIACWPSGMPRIPDDAEAGVRVRMLGDTTVNLDTAGKLVITEIGSEEDIYELATEFRLGGGGNAVGPYDALLIGNAREQSGAGTPRAAMKVTDTVIIDAERRTHVVTSDGFTTTGRLSAHAVRAVAGYLHDGETGELRSSRWLPLSQARQSLSNGAFATNITGWTADTNNVANVTATVSHDAAIGGIANGSLKAAITANTSGGGRAVEVYNTAQPIALNGREQVEVGGWVRSSATGVRPALGVLWYLGAIPLQLSWEATWTPVANTEYERVFAAAAPSWATHYAAALSVVVAASATGNAWFDDIRVNDTELFVYDVATGGLDVTVDIAPRWTP